ncbi:MAG: multicopper oxidase domain-containing protein [Gemmatimonas sp.]|nr:multicopper oxidase domain-containing protein [Gemmatimonas sp.]
MQATPPAIIGKGSSNGRARSSPSMSISQFTLHNSPFAAVAAALLAACAVPAPSSHEAVNTPAAVDFCPTDPADFTFVGAPSTDLYCVELIPPPELDGVATGVAQLAPPASPFGAAVTIDGRHRYRTTFLLRGLPDPATLGDYSTYVAWAMPPTLAPVTRLGPVRNGRVETGEVALNKFYLLVSAEVSDSVSERRGPLVLRGLSASTRMRDPHFVGLGPAASSASSEYAGQAAPRTAASPGSLSPLVWGMPPHDPRVPMSPMGTEHRVPAATPFLPGGDVEAESIPLARPRELLRVEDGDTIALTAGLVRRTLAGRDLVMYGFNGQYPGPLIHVPQAATITVDFTNRTEHPTAVHWHGIRLDNRFDGVPDLTQEPVPPGGSFRYRIHFPDAGIYWYHPHHREDIQQDLGLYGNLLVAPATPDYYGPAHREEVLMLDDLLVGDEGLVPYGLEQATFAMTGRFGNLLLVNGEPRYELEVRDGEVVRFHLTNASNTRTFNLSFEGARMKVVATDVGRFEREEWVESVAIAPAERYVVDVRFERPGRSALTNRVQGIDHMMGQFLALVDTLGTVQVAAESASRDFSASFGVLRRHPEVAAEIERYRPHFDRPADFELDLAIEDRGLPFELTRVMRLDSLYFNPVEWAGTMPMMDWLPTSSEVRWIMRDARTGAENEAIDWRFEVGDVVRLRLRNQRHSLHAMQHPIHIHGQRFLVLAVNGVPVENHAWKDTVLVPVGMTVDILLELSNPGRWMVHCHIAEHLEAGMQFVINVD